MEKLKSFFSINPAWKLISLIVAFALWFIVINVENPPDERSKTTKISVIHKEELSKNNKMIVGQEKDLDNLFVSIKVRGSRKDLDVLYQNADSIIARLDFKDASYLTPNEIKVPVYVELPEIASEVEIIEQEPRNIEFDLEDLKTKELSIEFFSTGKIADGYMKLEAEIEPKSLQIVGSSTDLEKISYAIVNVDLNSADTDIEIKDVKPKFYDKNDKEVLSIDSIPSTVSVKIPIKKLFDLDLSEIETKGEVKDGYEISLVEQSFKTLTIAVDEKEISKLKNFKLEAIDVSNISANTVIEIDILNYLPENTKIVSSSGSKLKIKFTVKKIE